MIDKNLLRLLGDNKKYIFYTVGLMVLGLFANVGITAAICWVINLAIHYDEYSGHISVARRMCSYLYHRALYRIPTCRRLKGHARQKGKKRPA